MPFAAAGRAGKACPCRVLPCPAGQLAPQKICILGILKRPDAAIMGACPRRGGKSRQAPAVCAAPRRLPDREGKYHAGFQFCFVAAAVCCDRGGGFVCGGHPHPLYHPKARPDRRHGGAELCGLRVFPHPVFEQRFLLPPGQYLHRADRLAAGRRFGRAGRRVRAGAGRRGGRRPRLRGDHLPAQVFDRHRLRHGG